MKDLLIADVHAGRCTPEQYACELEFTRPPHRFTQGGMPIEFVGMFFWTLLWIAVARRNWESSTRPKAKGAVAT